MAETRVSKSESQSRNPLLGPQFFELALKVVNGETVPRWVPSKEGIFLPEDAARVLPTREY